LNQDPPLSGFTTWRAEDHSHDFGNASVQERVRRRAPAACSGLIPPHWRLSSVPEAIRSRVAMPNLTFSAEPIKTFGRLATNRGGWNGGPGSSMIDSLTLFLALVPSILLVVGVFAIAVWAARLPDEQSFLVAKLTGKRTPAARTRAETNTTDPGRNSCADSPPIHHHNDCRIDGTLRCRDFGSAPVRLAHTRS